MGNNKTDLDAIKSAIIDFYNDPLYQELNAYYSKKTIFNILKIERNENRHSAFLAWLLDKNINHGLGDVPLKKLLRFLYIRNEVNFYDSCLLSGNYLIENLVVSTEERTRSGEKDGRIDVYLEFKYRYNTNDKEEKQLCVIIENKMYTQEHGEQTKRYRKWAEKEKKIARKEIIGVFLSPNKVDKCSGDLKDKNFEFLKIEYQDLSDYVLEPLLLLDMPQETRFIIRDYVINLEKPVKERDENDNIIDKEDTILAVSKTKENVFQKIYEEHALVLDASLYAKNRKNIEDFKKIYPNYEDFQQLSENDCKLVESFWDSNAALLKIIMSSVLENNFNPDEDAERSSAIDVLLDVKKNNRNKTKYVVKDKSGNIMNDEDKKGKAKPAFMSLASYYIFKAWLQAKENATLKELREAFPVEQCAPHYKDTYKYLFYTNDKIQSALKYNKKDSTYYEVRLEEDEDVTKKYLTWDFYRDGNHFLQVKNGDTEVDVLSIKYWTPDAFKNHLVKHAEQYGISVEPQ